MSQPIQAVRGMNDLLPDTAGAWYALEQGARAVLSSYGYREIRLPLVEKTELYARAIGQVTDIVEKEMYTFDDRNGDSLTLRPEGTAGCVRAGIENGLFYNQTQRLWYSGAMFRHERPQKGRYRQFHQIGVEAFGFEGPDVDAELIAMSARLWRALEVPDLTLQINSLGTPASRVRYREDLVKYFTRHGDALDEDSKRRLGANPLRILDSKNPDLQTVIAGAPQLIDYLDTDSQVHFAQLKVLLDTMGIAYRVNPRLVRGLDYYTRTVFEWVTDRLGAQGTVCAGGRYDGLVEQLGGKATPAIGFAIGMERLLELIPAHCSQDLSGFPHVYVLSLGVGSDGEGMRIAEELRDAGVRVQINCGGGSVKNQMKKADRSGARFAVIVGDAELARREATVKDLRSDDAQISVSINALRAHIAPRIFK